MCMYTFLLHGWHNPIPQNSVLKDTKANAQLRCVTKTYVTMLKPGTNGLEKAYDRIDDVNVVYITNDITNDNCVRTSPIGG